MIHRTDHLCIGPQLPANAITWWMPASRRPCLGFVPSFLTASVFFPSSLKVFPRPSSPPSPSSLVYLILSFHSLPFQARFCFLMFLPLLAALGLAVPSAFAQQPGTFVATGNTLVSAMMVCRQYTLLNPSLNNLRCLWVAPTRCTSSIKWRVMRNKSAIILLTQRYGESKFLSYAFRSKV
jgi:hypothetical protein